MNILFSGVDKITFLTAADERNVSDGPLKKEDTQTIGKISFCPS